MMSYCALSELHIIPQGQTVTGKYYVEEILEKAVLSAFNRTHKNGSVLTCKMCPRPFSSKMVPLHITQPWHNNGFKNPYPDFLA